MLHSCHAPLRIVLRSNLCLLLSAAAMLICLGCGESPRVAPVSGTITYDGKPLVGASITTQPIATESMKAGSGSFATTDDQGKFELELVKPAMKGAIIADHRVMISRADGGQATDKKTAADGEVEYWTDDPRGGKDVGRGWPKQFTDGSLRLSVPPEGKTDANFDLKP
jgi:uncharacterized protein DUF6795